MNCSPYGMGGNFTLQEHFKTLCSVQVPQCSIFVLAQLVALCGLFHISRELLPAESRVQDRLWVLAFVISMVSARYQPASDLGRKRTFVWHRLQGRGTCRYWARRNTEQEEASWKLAEFCVWSPWLCWVLFYVWHSSIVIWFFERWVYLSKICLLLLGKFSKRRETRLVYEHLVSFFLKEAGRRRE